MDTKQAVLDQVGNQSVKLVFTGRLLYFRIFMKAAFTALLTGKSTIVVQLSA